MVDDDLKALTDWFKKNVWELSGDEAIADETNVDISNEPIVEQTSNADSEDSSSIADDAVQQRVERARIVEANTYDRKKEEQELFEYIAGLGRY
ncbi:MAG: hypothetical protein HKO02_02240 [Hyphomonadaceae bacterium]|nr:hypothetical protein [Hyphomonadaceae bacterium]